GRVLYDVREDRHGLQADDVEPAQPRSEEHRPAHLGGTSDCFIQCRKPRNPPYKQIAPAPCGEYLIQNEEDQQSFDYPDSFICVIAHVWSLLRNFVSVSARLRVTASCVRRAGLPDLRTFGRLFFYTSDEQVDVL